MLPALASLADRATAMHHHPRHRASHEVCCLGTLKRAVPWLPRRNEALRTLTLSHVVSGSRTEGESL